MREPDGTLATPIRPSTSAHLSNQERAMSDSIASSASVQRDERRRFNRRERVALFLASEGRCSRCGCDLAASWHGDHVTPHSQGGATDVANGQALCPACNLTKGAGVIADRVLTTMFTLRSWQRDGFGKWQAANRRDFLAVATPGAGKTTFALYIAAFLLEAGIIRRVVVVVPSDRLRKQWATAAARVGIQLDDAFANRLGTPARDFDGVVVTYHAVAHEPTIHRALCDAMTLVIFDEIHHAGDRQSWGRGLRYAFENAGKRLAITGTPFRSDSARIPFVSYGPQDNRSVADFSYGYEDALRERVCRNVYFPSYEGNMQWWTSRGGERSARFGDELPTEEESRRLNAALDPSGDWLPQVLRDADARLRDVRVSHYEHAAGLVICKDREHAQAVADLLARITGERPARATSDDPDAARIIEEFSEGRGDLTGDPYRGLPRWLVAVRMVSEGVDIPRLFVGVFATNIMTELHFRQVVGRFVRTMDGVEDQAGYLFIPKVDRLVEYVQRIKTERDHVIEGEEPAEEEVDNEREKARRVSDFVLRGSEAEADSVFYDEAELQPGLLGEARKFALAFGHEGMNVYMLAKLMRDMGEWQAFVDRGEMPMRKPIVVDTPRPSKLSTDKLHAKRELKSFVNRLCSATGVTHERVYGALKRRQGTDQDHASLDQLIQRKEWVKGWIEIATQLDHDLTEWEWDEVMVDGQPPR